MTHLEFKVWQGNSLFKHVKPTNLLARSKVGSHGTPSQSKTHPSIILNFLKSTHKTKGCDHCTSSILIDEGGGAGLSSLHTTLEGPT